MDTPGVGGQVQERNVKWIDQISQDSLSCFGIFFILKGGEITDGVSNETLFHNNLKILKFL